MAPTLYSNFLKDNTSRLLLCSAINQREIPARSLLVKFKPCLLGVQCSLSSPQDPRPRQNVAVVITALALSAVQAFSPILESPFFLAPQPAEAVLYSPDTAKLPRSGEVALRRSIPAFNPSMKTIQNNLEEIFYLLRIPQRKPYSTMASSISSSIQLVKNNKAVILAAFPEPSRTSGEKLLDDLVSGGKGSLEGLAQAVELKDADKIANRLVGTLEAVADIMQLQASGLPYFLPSQYASLPSLTGRATVVFTVAKGDGSRFSLQSEGQGGSRETVDLEIVLDGYSAPITAGNFARLVQEGKYDGAVLRSANQALISDTAAPVPGGTDLPLEIMPTGEASPIYKTPLDVQDGEIPVLPLSVYGAVAMAHGEGADTSSNPSQFFLYLYDKRNSGLGGLSFEEGQFAVFGYVLKGREALAQLKTGDVISAAKLVSGQDRLLLPQ